MMNVGIVLEKFLNCSSRGDDFLHILCELFEKLEKEEVELMVTIARRIWLRRNTVVFGGDLTHPSQLQDGSQKDTESISDSLKN